MIDYSWREISKVEVFIDCTLSHFLLFHNLFHSDAFFIKFFISPGVGKGSDDEAVVVIDAHQSDLSGVVDIA